MNTQEKIWQRAALAARLMAVASSVRKDAALSEVARLLEKHSEEWRAAQYTDVTAAGKAGRAAAIITQQEMETAAEDIFDLSLTLEPIGASNGGAHTQNGTRLQTVKAPLGAVGILCGTRPLWAMRAVALAIKTGNAVVVGIDNDFSGAIRLGVELWRQSLQKAGLPVDVVQTTDAPDEMLADGAPLKKLFIDDTYPTPTPATRLPLTRVEQPRVTAYADDTVTVDRVVEWAIDWATASAATAGELLLVNRHQAPTLLPMLKEAAAAKNLRLTGCEEIAALADIPTESDWLSAAPDRVRVRVVDSLNQVLALVQVCGQGHIAALLTDSCEAARRFGVAAEAAVVATNGRAPLVAAQLCDGLCLGMGFGAENGPVGLEAFTVNKQTVSD